MENTKTVTRTALQYSRPLPEETLDVLRGIARDYCKVKNCVYRRYSGVGSVGRLTPVYGILNEMRACGLRRQLKLPSVYYELAVAEAVGDIKGMWGILKNTIRERIGKNENLDQEEKMYLWTVLKLNGVFAAILTHQDYEMPKKTEGLDLDTERLNNLLRRLVRRNLEVPCQETADNFLVSPAGYRYADGGLYLVSREPRKRMFLPLKGTASSSRQIRILIREDDVKIAYPVDIETRRRADYCNTIYAFIGDGDMLTLSSGKVYGERLGELANPETERLAEKNQKRQKARQDCRSCMESDPAKAEKIRKNNLGRKKYDEQKRRGREKTQNFINAELNRMFREEKPAKIVIGKSAAGNRRAGKFSPQENRRIARSFQGYIKKQLVFKCRLNAVELEEVSPGGNRNTCCRCGGEGSRDGGEFLCAVCGLRIPAAANAAKNIERAAEESGKR